MENYQSSHEVVPISGIHTQKLSKKLRNDGGRVAVGSKVRRVGRGWYYRCCYYCCYSIVGLLFRDAIGRGYRETMREPRATRGKDRAFRKKKKNRRDMKSTREIDTEIGKN